SIIGADSNGCTSTASKVITVNACDTATLASNMPDMCATSAESIKDINTKRWPVTPGIAAIAWPGTIIHCGPFALYYDDLSLATHQGFNDTINGVCYQNTLCEVLNYISTLINCNSVTAHGGFITIHVQSWEGAANPPGNFKNALAIGGPQYGYNGSNWPNAGIYDGKTFDHITTGIDPDPNQFDGTLTVNFDGATANGGPFTWACDSGALGHCDYDFYTVMLHEMTHVLGFISNIQVNPVNHLPITGTNNYTLYDWSYLYQSATDLYWNNNSPAWTHLLGGTMVAPILNAVNPIQSNIWTYNINQFGGINSANTNQPVYSGESPYEMHAVSGWDIVMSYLSHMDLSPCSYTTRSSAAPGFQPGYVMEPASFPGDAHRKWTEPEMRILAGMQNGANQYLFNPSTTINGITPDNSIINNNHPPINREQNTDGYSMTSIDDLIYPDYYYVNANVAPPFPNFYQKIDATILNAPGNYIYDVTTDPNIMDPDGDPVTIVPGSLYNIRGCGNQGGNDHGQLVLNAANTQITFTARPGFVGIAQFGFYITDGKEVGAYVVKTINVQTGAAFINPVNPNTPPTCATCHELVVNGDWEDGTEVKTTPLNENKFNTSFIFGVQEGNYYTGTQFADAHPLEWISTGAAALGGCIIKDSYKDCNSGTVPYEFGTQDYSSPLATPHVIPAPNPPGNNNRFHWLRGAYNYCTLASSSPNQNTVPVKNCTPYVLTFDINFADALNSNPGLINYNMTVGFTGNIPTPFAANTYNFSFPVNVTPTAAWQTISIPFWYCGTVPAGPTGLTFMNFDCDGNYVFIDNVSLVVNSNPPPMALTIAASQNPVCANTNIVLTPTVINGSCNLLYSWNTGATTSSINVSPGATTTYTLTVSDGCGILNPVQATYTVTVNPLPVITTTVTAACSGQCNGSITTNVGGATAPYLYVWSPGGSSNSSITNLCAGTYSLTVTDGLGCVNTTTVTVSGVAPTITVSPTNPSYCSGGSVLLTASGVNTYTWTPNTALSATTGSSVTASPSSTLTYTVNGTSVSGCPASAQTIVVTVNATPTVNASAVSPTICLGNSTTLNASGATTYTWTPNTSISATTGASVIVNPSSTIAYTVTGTTAGCTGASKTVVVTVSPTPTVTASATPPTICSGSSTTLNAGGASLYTWTPNTALSATTGVSVTATPSSTITYTVNGISAAGCPASAQTVVVTV
ncbi:MAG TPA: hypothetical protein VK890_11300, partial [Bacteroidia bacterium]|nr:hypothetical protein [Bacteroidia bacterium]